MGENSAIEWTNHTLNFWQGCYPVSEGCDNCYMYRDKKRYGQDPAKIVRSKDATFNQARKWKNPAKVFVCSWSDFFIEEADEWREDAWNEIRNAPHLTWIILTKRPENIAERLPRDWGNGWPNVWLGVTAENQKRADERIPILLEIPAAVRFVSVEPMLSEVFLYRHFKWPLCKWWPQGGDPNIYGKYYWKKQALCGAGWQGIDWVITGCESGQGRREAEVNWFRSLRDQCIAANVPFFLKQMDINGKLVKMPELDGQVWDQYPEGR